MNNFNQLIESMGKHAQAEYPKECCGLITKEFSYIACKNISPLPKESFIIDPESLLEYENDCWGIFHSHPGEENPIPSEEDKRGAVFEEYKFIVGFNTKFYIYWLDKNIDALKFDEFKEDYLH